MKKKSLQEIEMPKTLNCGLEALSKFGNLKNVSAFTLVHLARDNGQTIQVFKVLDNKDLVRVVRPAIFHQKDHFVYVGKDEPMPEGEYTGFVLGNTILGRVVSLAEAKFITGGKNFFTGKNSDGEQTGAGAWRDILTAVVAVTATLIGGPGFGAAAGAATYAETGAIERAQNQDQLGSPGDPKLLAGDALRGGVEGLTVGSGVAGIQAGSSAAAASGTSYGLPQAVQNFGQGAFQGISHPINTSLHGLDASAAGIAGSVNPASVTAFNAAAGGAQNAAGVSSSGINAGANAVNAFNASTPAMSLASGGVGNAAGATISNVGNFTPNNFVNNPAFSTSGLNLPSNLSNTSTSGGIVGNIGNTIGNAITSNPLGSAATLAGAAGVFGSQPPAYTGATPVQNYQTTSQFLGPNALQKPTNDQLSTYISTPIEDLAKTFTSNSTRVTDAINQAYDNQKQGLVHQFAQAGQNLSNSSELQDKVSQLEQKRSTDLSNAALEVQNAGVSQAIQVKQQALSQGMQAGQFNQTLAMQLAGLTGDQQNLQYAIANNDYQGFQQIMGKLLTMGIPQNVNVTNGIK